MSVLGIVAEYNPFHNGHKYHLDESKKLTGSQYSVCVMSGNFIQRGEPAIVDKFARARMALEAGIDLVIELPTVYALNTAELFSYGGIKILDSLGIVDNICFGSENGTIEELKTIADVLVDEPLEYKNILKKYLSLGLPFPSAREKAIEEYLGEGHYKTLIGTSNNILGIEYLKALKKCNSNINPHLIKRKANDYNSKEITGDISSATSIRDNIFKTGNIESIKEQVPLSTYKILKENFDMQCGPISKEDFSKTIISIIRKLSVNELTNVFDVSEGLENKIKKSANNTSDIDNLISLIKSKRYTQTRIQRILFHILLGITKDFYKEAEIAGGPQYIRVLGFNENGRQLLNTAKKKSTLPIITKVAHFKNSDNSALSKMLEYDIIATNLYNLAYNNPEYTKGDIDYTNKIIITSPPAPLP